MVVMVVWALFYFMTIARQYFDDRDNTLFKIWITCKHDQGGPAYGPLGSFPASLASRRRH